MLKGKNIVLGVTGGIACYKACELVSRLVKGGANVDVIMTRNATRFVAPLTFETLSGNPVTVDTFEREREWEVGHIALAKKCDLLVIAPATANVIGKIACGIADDMLTTTVTATRAVKLICPAMNTGMYENAIVRRNMETLSAMPDYEFLYPACGRLACGDVGSGKLREPSEIYDRIEEILADARDDYAGKRVLITAGGTEENIDGVRCITNHSSGKMGAALAQAALKRGADVTVIAGNISVNMPDGARLVRVKSTREMYDAVMKEYREADIVIKAAAPSDYRLEREYSGKLKGDSITLELVKNPDIAAALGKVKGDRILAVFCAETSDLTANAAKKLDAKNADLIVANDVTQEGAGFGTDTNIATILTSGGKRTDSGLVSKAALADMILDEIAEL